MSDTFCSYLWNHVHLRKDGTVKPCCAYRGVLPEGTTVANALTSPAFEELRDKARRGERIIGCGECYEREDIDAGDMSLRQIANRHRYPTATPDDEPSLTYIQIDLGTLCNNACIMCSSAYSSRWRRDEIALGLTPTEMPVRIDLEEQLRGVDFSKVRFLKFMGGEPFLFEDEMTDIIARCPDLKRLHIVTNATRQPRERFRSLVARVPTFLLNLSIEAMGVKNDYIRWGSVWSEIEDNVAGLVRINPHQTSIATVVAQALNVMELPALEAWLSKNGVRINLDFLRRTTFLDFAYLDVDMKREILDGIKLADDVQDRMLRQTMMGIAPNPNKVHQFIGYLRALDAVRGTDHRAIFPEFFEVFDRYHS